MIFRSWSAHFPPDVEVVGVTLPGHWGRVNVPALTNMNDLIAALLPVLLPLLDRPFIVFGHSMGALVAFELLRALRRRGAALPAMQLVVSACRAPHLQRTAQPIHALPEADFLRRVVAMGGMPEEMLRHPELLELLVPSLRADFEVVETWRYEDGAPLDVPIQAYGGAEDPFVSREAIEMWSRHTRSEFSAHHFAGNHFYYLNDETAFLARLSQQARQQ